MYTPHLGNFSKGIRAPLTNTSGNFTKVESMTTSAGTSVGYAEIKTPRDEKHKSARRMLSVRSIGLSTSVNTVALIGV